jgi:hypothetical protein
MCTTPRANDKGDGRVPDHRITTGHAHDINVATVFTATIAYRYSALDAAR